MITKSHHFFLLHVRSWPPIVRFSSFNLLFSGLLFLKYRESDLLAASLLSLCWVCFCWWLRYSSEIIGEGLDSSSLIQGLKYRIILFISSEIFFFFSFFWSYFHYFLAPVLETGLVWPPYSIEIFDCLNVPLINTLILMRSGVSVTLRHYYLIRGRMNFSLIALAVTIGLGIIFSYLQYQEYKRSFFSIRDSTFGTSFYILTGFHGTHVIIGTIFLSVVLFRSIRSSSRKKEILIFELASWYWHFVDVVWIFLYFIIYYLGN